MASKSGVQSAPSAVIAASAKTARYHSGISGNDASTPDDGW